MFCNSTGRPQPTQRHPWTTTPKCERLSVKVASARSQARANRRYPMARFGGKKYGLDQQAKGAVEMAIKI